jgi:hypothetical protein
MPSVQATMMSPKSASSFESVITVGAISSAFEVGESSLYMTFLPPRDSECGLR